jgi:hypothetical protein
VAKVTPLESSVGWVYDDEQRDAAKLIRKKKKEKEKENEKRKRKRKRKRPGIDSVRSAGPKEQTRVIL